jgi:hypothetical protein
MIFGKILNSYQQSGGALRPAAIGNNEALSSGTAKVEQPAASQRLEITNVWSGPIIILSNDSQMELEKHYLNYNSTIPAASFDAIFRGRSLDEA